MSPSVLVVEPHADLRIAIVAALNRAAVLCDAVATAGEARLKLSRCDYQYILLDIDSPPGVKELCDSLLSEPGLQDRIVVISDSDTHPAELRHQLQKPFDSGQLLAQVGR